MSSEDNLGLNAGTAAPEVSAPASGVIAPEPKPAVPQDEVNELVRDGWSRGYKKAEEKYANTVKQEQRSASVPAATSEDHMTLVQREVQRQIGELQAAERKKLNDEAAAEHTKRILGKINSLASEDPDIENKIFTALPPQTSDGTINKAIGALYVYADQVPNTGEVLKYLAENDEKADKILAAMSRSPERAFKKVQELSEALIAEKVTKSATKSAPPPLSAPTKNKANVGGSTYLDRKADILRKYRV